MSWGGFTHLTHQNTQVFMFLLKMGNENQKKNSDVAKCRMGSFFQSRSHRCRSNMHCKAGGWLKMSLVFFTTLSWGLSHSFNTHTVISPNIRAKDKWTLANYFYHCILQRYSDIYVHTCKKKKKKKLHIYSTCNVILKFHDDPLYSQHLTQHVKVSLEV